MTRGILFFLFVWSLSLSSEAAGASWMKNFFSRTYRIEDLKSIGEPAFRHAYFHPDDPTRALITLSDQAVYRDKKILSRGYPIGVNLRSLDDPFFTNYLTWNYRRFYGQLNSLGAETPRIYGMRYLVNTDAAVALGQRRLLPSVEMERVQFLLKDFLSTEKMPDAIRYRYLKPVIKKVARIEKNFYRTGLFPNDAHLGNIGFNIGRDDSVRVLWFDAADSLMSSPMAQKNYQFRNPLGMLRAYHDDVLGL